MSKKSCPSRRRSRARRTRTDTSSQDRAERVDVMTQLGVAVRNPSSALLGALLGGVVPWFARELAHAELPAAWAAGRTGVAALVVAVILGCAAFSMLTVYKFGRAAFGDRRKAIGFVLALEGVMLVTQGQTSSVALALLIVINAIANGCTIALGRDATMRRAEADARRSATRAQNRAAARTQRAEFGAQDAPAPAARPPVSRASRPVAAPATAPQVVWHPRWVTDASDAEIVDERLVLS